MTENTISWTINLQCEPEQAEEMQALLEQITQQVRTIGASCSVIQVVPMTAKAARASGMSTDIENVAAMMRQQGVPEAQIKRQQLLIAAQMGQGSWDAVVEAVETELAEHRAANNVVQEVGALLTLVEYTMNGGQKKKAVDYFKQAEMVIMSRSWATSTTTELSQLPPEAHEQVKATYLRQLERLRNWLF